MAGGEFQPPTTGSSRGGVILLTAAPARNMRLESIDGSVGFSVFMRKNERFPENFSIGLIVQPQDEPGSFCILRYNGKHGEHINRIFDPEPHFGFHIHKAETTTFEEGLSPELYAELTDSYSSFEEALLKFSEHINLKEDDKKTTYKKRSLSKRIIKLKE